MSENKIRFLRLRCKLRISNIYKVNNYLVYAARFSSTNLSDCFSDQPLHWKYRVCSSGPMRLPCNTTKSAVPTTGMKFRGR